MNQKPYTDLQPFPLASYMKSELYAFYQAEGFCYGTFYNWLQTTISNHPQVFPLKPRKSFTTATRKRSRKKLSFSNRILTAKQVECFLLDHGAPKGWKSPGDIPSTSKSFILSPKVPVRNSPTNTL